MRTTRGLERLVFFSDAVVAIAITLLVLPLVETVPDFEGDIGVFLLSHLNQLLAFALSFAVIGNFWVVHHRIYEKADGYSAGLLRANLLWLASIVFLPFPTALVASQGIDDRGTNALYIGTILVTTATGLLQQWLLIRSPELQAEAARGTLSIVSPLTTTIIIVVALVVAVVAPSVGLWSLLLLFLGRPIDWLVERRKARP